MNDYTYTDSCGHVYCSTTSTYDGDEAKITTAESVEHMTPNKTDNTKTSANRFGKRVLSIGPMGSGRG